MRIGRFSSLPCPRPHDGPPYLSPSLAPKRQHYDSSSHTRGCHLPQLGQALASGMILARSRLIVVRWTPSAPAMRLWAPHSKPPSSRISSSTRRRRSSAKKRRRLFHRWRAAWRRQTSSQVRGAFQLMRAPVSRIVSDSSRARRLYSASAPVNRSSRGLPLGQGQGILVIVFDCWQAWGHALNPEGSADTPPQSVDRE